MKEVKLCFLVSLLIFLFSGCKDDSVGPLGPDVDIISDNIVLNPSQVAPLTATINLDVSNPVRVSINVLGKNGSGSNIENNFEQTSTNHEIPVLGLYPNYENAVKLTFFDSNNQELGTKEYSIETDPLISDLPKIDINTANIEQMADGLTFVSYFGHDGESNPQRPFMFDANGDIRWYLDFRSNQELSDLFYDDGIERLQNGNLYFGDLNTNKIYEINMLGEVLNTWDMPGYGFHHEVKEKPNGNFLVTVNNNSLPTVEDHIIEIDRSSGDIINVWNLNESLDNTRTTWDTDLTDISVDWFHANAVEFDESDNTIIVSGRTQGVVKLNEENEVIWILAPHKGWETSGKGTDLNQFLLQPLDVNNEPITDEAVLTGDENHSDFEWPWYQHAPQVMPNGNVILFDNGDNRNYTGNNLYSRAVEYEIDKENMTIKQVWSYGKDRDGETYSRIVSDVDYFADENHVFFSPGAVLFGETAYGKAIEIDYDQHEVIFEATITPPAAAFGIITLHRTERMSIYPNENNN